MELVIPTAFVEFTLGLSALIVSLAALVIPQLPLQIALFLVMSVAITLLARRVMPRQRARSIEDAAQGTILAPILPGQSGRILYEGSSWQARCDDPELAIALHEPVYIVSRKGNTLLVLPERLLCDNGHDSISQEQ
ncbi:MAG: NfeD family protein [Elainellaceae cyanobacterium]